jgi:hypothetical protein
MMNSHSEIAVPYDSYFIVPMARRRRSYEDGHGLDIGAFVADLFAYWQVHRWGLSERDVRGELANNQPSDWAEAVRSVFALYARSKGKGRYADKTPSYLPHLPLLAECFPEARFVHVIRDGRDVALSWLSREWGPPNLAQAAVYWAANVQAGRRAGRWLGAERYTEIRYERLVVDPESTLLALCTFLNITFDRAMLDYSATAAPLVASDPNPLDHQGLFQPPSRRLRDWRSDMAAEEVALFETLAGDVLGDLGYERAATHTL